MNNPNPKIRVKITLSVSFMCLPNDEFRIFFFPSRNLEFEEHRELFNTRNRRNSNPKVVISTTETATNGPTVLDSLKLTFLRYNNMPPA
jgi:hypothetical protein